MVSRVYGVAFEGVEGRLVDVQCALSPGVPAFTIVGLPDKAVNEARDRIRAALEGLRIALPSKRITINLSPADLPKEGAHFDLPIALSVIAALGLTGEDATDDLLAMGELSLTGDLVPVAGALPAALAAAGAGLRLACPASNGGEAAWIDTTEVLAAPSLGALLAHLGGTAPLPAATPRHADPAAPAPCFSEVRGQERAKRMLEIAAAGRHHALLMGPPGSGKSMLARRIGGILPPMSAAERLETSLIHSLAGQTTQGLIGARPFCEPHHTASVAALTGGGRRARPGQVSLAHNGVLFLDELPEFARNTLDALRQPIETGEITIARARAHTRYPCRFLLIAAANPCRCGHMADPARACTRAPICGAQYLDRLSGPMLDRFDLRLELPPVALSDLHGAPTGDPSTVIAARVAATHSLQAARFSAHDSVRFNADMQGALLDEVCALDSESQALIARAADRFGLTARGYHRVLRVARTIADLAGAAQIARPHLAEALSYRLVGRGD